MLPLSNAKCARKRPPAGVLQMVHPSKSEFIFAQTLRLRREAPCRELTFELLRLVLARERRHPHARPCAAGRSHGR
ncbi:hypothetical protein SBV1_2600001 [Verrucomicrobia bacterium]|nr:hypothetical protein SBV1_2600001 [Verrucomicrobiota bacterium]